MSYYQNLTFDEQQKVLSAMAGLRLNAGKGQAITREDINIAFARAVGKPLSIEYMRDSSVVQLMGLLGSGRGNTRVHGRGEKAPKYMPLSSTDAHLAARGMPVSNPSMGSSLGSTRYSARVGK